MIWWCSVLCILVMTQWRIQGRGTVVFVCKNGESWSFNRVYFVPCLMTNIMSIGQLDEIGYKIDIDTGMIKIREPGVCYW
jgi:hypothetical protein